MVYILYYRSGTYSPRQRIILGILRFTSLILLALLALRPLWIDTIEELEKPILIWLEDVSASVLEQKDSLYQNSYLESKEAEIAELQEQYDIHSYKFSDRLYQDSVEFKEITNLSRAVQELKDIYLDQNPSALVLSSDGIVNRGKALNNVNLPNNWPLYIQLQGNSEQQSFAKIDALRFNEKVLLARSTEIEFDLKSLGLNDERLRLKLYLNGNLLAEKIFDLNENPWYESGSFEIEAKEIGLQQLRLELSGDSGLLDKKDFNIRVEEAKIKVLLYASSIQPDLAAIQNALSSDPLISIAFSDQIDAIRASEQDLVIATNIELGLLKRLKEENLPYFLMLDAEEALEWRPLGDVGQEKQYASWNPNFNYFPINEEQMELWPDFPPLDGIYGATRSLEPAMPLFFKNLDGIVTNEALAYLEENEQGQRTAILLGRGIWRWRIHNYRIKGNFEAFDQWIQDVVQYLLAQERKEPLQVNWDENLFEDLNTRVTAKLYDKSGNLINNKDLKLDLFQGADLKYSYNFQSYQNYYRLKLQAPIAGNYRYKAEVDLEDRILSTEGQIQVLSNDLESQNLVAEHASLRRLAIENGGVAYTLDSLDLLFKDLGQREVSMQIRERKIKREILSRWPLFFVILSLLGLEWFLRKYWGRY